MELTLSTREVGDKSVVEAAGEVDVYTAPQLDEELTRIVESGTYALVVDLTNVDFLDSTGLGVLVKTLKRVREHGGSLAIVATADRITKVFRITGLDSVMTLTDSVDAATGA